MSLPHREKIPAPKEVNVVSGENHDGDPAFFLTVVFAKKEAPAKFPLKKLRPCIEGVTRRCGEGMRRRDAAIIWGVVNYVDKRIHGCQFC